MRLVGLLLVVCILSISAVADELHVGVGQAYSTIESAYADVWSGDTIVIHEGVYTSFPAIDAYDSSKQNITFKRYQNDKVVIRKGGYVYLRYNDGYVFDGLIFDGIDQTHWGFYIRDAAHYTRFYNCIFTNFTQALYIYGGGSGGWVSDVIIDGCTFFNNSDTGLLTASSVKINYLENCLFIANKIAVNHGDSQRPIVADFCGFKNNLTNLSSYVSYGKFPVLGIMPVFESTDISNPYFMYLAYDCPIQILKGASDYSYIGARGVAVMPAKCGDAHTYYQISDIAGPDGVGHTYRDCEVNLYDVIALASNWLEQNP